MASPKFPRGFLWGASSSAYQIEGALDADGRKPCVWDTYVGTGNTADGTTAVTACDHYHRWPEDIALMKDAGFNAYRFSIAWPRVVPGGDGPVNAKGLDFYDRLVDALLEAGLRPIPCLFHWDLPQALEDRGGWQTRVCTGPFAEYARVCARRLADRAPDWMMLNEPNIVAILGYGQGVHAPGKTLGEEGILRALHHQNLAQGAALRAIAAEHPGVRLGTVINLQPCLPETDSAEDAAAAARWDAVWNRVALDGVMRGRIPPLLEEHMQGFVLPGDEESMGYPIDLLGINYYSCNTMKHQPGAFFDAGWGDPHCDRRTFMGWPVQPEGLYAQLMEFKRDYGNPTVVVAENGAAYDDVVEPDGSVHDADRTAYIREHLEAVARAIQDGCDVAGYLVWSLLDNFEWGFGLGKRFGIVRVDFDTLKRTPKDSYRFLGTVAKGGRL